MYLRFVVVVLMAILGWWLPASAGNPRALGAVAPTPVTTSSTTTLADNDTDNYGPNQPIRKQFYRIYRHGSKPLPLIFAEALAGGLIAVFTPYVYSFVPITLGTLLYRTQRRNERVKNTALFAGFVWLIFIALGALVALLAGSAGIEDIGHHWLFNLFFFRLLGGLGLSLLGAFDIKLPLRIVRFTQAMAQSHSVRGIFFMALSLPVVTFSSTMPLMGLVLVLSGKGGIWGPLVGMSGFAVGISTPFIYPRIINLMPISALNYLKVLMGFVALLLALKFLSNADVTEGWHLLSRELFIAICMLLSLLVGIHMLGWIKLSNDYANSRNAFGQAYVSITRLLLSAGAFTLFLYLLPGLWGAPLHGVSLLLPPALP
ncbi:MAG: hypothetical protein EBZ77_05945 [Chitinophagia bacterium]|nr:hypothetical protein [Chitinophagia bacterium]